MAKGSASIADKVFALVAEIEAEAYARGQIDARKELLDVLGGAKGGAPPARAARGRRPAPKRRAGGGKRAPRGSVRRFVERVLRGHPDSAASEIPGHAADETERSIKLASIRVELRNGRLQGRYVSDSGRWSLAVAETTAATHEETVPSDPSPGSVPAAEEAARGPAVQGDGGASSEPSGEGSRGTLGLNL